MRYTVGLRVLASVILAYHLVPATARAQQFEQKVSALRDATRSFQVTRTRQLASTMANAIATLSDPNKVDLAAPPPADFTSIAERLHSIVQDVQTGTATVFAGAGLTSLSIQIQQTEAIWESRSARNLVDQVAPFLQVAGAALLATGLVLNADQTSASDPSGKTAGIGGALLIGFAPLLQRFLGSRDSQLKKTAGSIDQVAADIAQISFSRAAYDDLKSRHAIANDYYQKAKALVQPLVDLRVKLAAVKSTTTSAEMLSLVEDVIAKEEQYRDISSFVDSFTGELARMYERYNAKYAPLEGRLTTQIADINTFRDAYRDKIVNGFLKDFPTYRSALYEIRAAVANAETL